MFSCLPGSVARRIDRSDVTSRRGDTCWLELCRCPSATVITSKMTRSLCILQGCWNLAVRCCGSVCDLPWAADGSQSATGNDRGEQKSDDVPPEGERSRLLELAPSFFKVTFGGAMLPC